MSAWDIIWFDEVDSTMYVAQKIANEKGKHKVVVAAKKQKKGRGRLNRNWHSPEGGLWVSLLLKPKSSIEFYNIFSIISPLSIIETLKFFGISAKIKWPNDILVGDKKLAGILIESKLSRNNIEYIIIGIGINVNNSSTEVIDEDLKKRIISMKEVIHRTIDVKKVLSKLLHYFDKFYSMILEEGGITNLIRMYKKHSLVLKKRIKIVCADATILGQVLDITEDGFLILKTDKGIKKVLDGHTVEILS